MTTIKVDEVQYYSFLGTAKALVEKLEVQVVEDGIKLLTSQLKAYVLQQLQVRELMLERNMYYDFYVQNRNQNPDQASIAYQRYKKSKDKLEKLKQQEKI